MLSGRHIMLLGILACAGLLSVRDGQQQVDVCYQLGKVEKELRDIRADIQLDRIRHRALQSPKAVIERANELHLTVRPPGSECDSAAINAQTNVTTTVKSLGSVRPPQLPQPNVHGH
jgi:hypothetical protein